MSEAVPVTPRPSASVLLLRDGPAGLQVFLQTRVAGMSFAAGATVFPGGGVDASDLPVPEHWSGPSPDAWAERLGVPVADATGFVHAAVRETFEECGVLLATGPEDTAAGLAAGREDVVARRRTFATMLADNGLVVRTELLHAWARWITPIRAPIRYDTVFFTAIVPDDQHADDRTSEAVEARWWTPAEALAASDAGEISLLRPTRTNLAELAEFDSAAAVHAAAEQREIVAITPMRVPHGRTYDVLLPGDPGYDPLVATGGAR